MHVQSGCNELYLRLFFILCDVAAVVRLFRCVCVCVPVRCCGAYSHFILTHSDQPYFSTILHIAQQFVWVFFCVSLDSGGSAMSFIRLWNWCARVCCTFHWMYIFLNFIIQPTIYLMNPWRAFRSIDAHTHTWLFSLDISYWIIVFYISCISLLRSRRLLRLQCTVSLDQIRNIHELVKFCLI